MNTNGSDLPLDAVKLHRERRRARRWTLCRYATAASSIVAAS